MEAFESSTGLILYEEFGVGFDDFFSLVSSLSLSLFLGGCVCRAGVFGKVFGRDCVSKFLRNVEEVCGFGKIWGVEEVLVRIWAVLKIKKFDPVLGIGEVLERF